MKNKFLIIISLISLAAGFFALPERALAASVNLSFSPSSGTFVVDSTFDVSVYLDTQGQSVNTIELGLKYPPDKLQLVSSSTGKSIIGIWTSVPHYDNMAGTVHLVGGIPGGVNVSQGLITTFTFRVRAVGSAIVKFDSSRVLLNDGLGTEVLSQNTNSVYNLVLPPPGGPVVASRTHPNQTAWYDNANADLTWSTDGGATAYSYVLNDSPIDTPDDIAEGDQQEVSYHDLEDGRHYFHIKSLRGGQWGGVTNFALNIDTSPPAEFQIEISPDSRTTHTQPVIQFATTDQFSGLDHYELKLVPLNQSAASTGDNPLFIEAQSPYVPPGLALGEYDVIVRAYDKAGNIREITQRMNITTALFKFVDDRGLVFRSTGTIPWWLVWVILILLLLAAAYLAYRTWAWHRYIHDRHVKPPLPSSLEAQLADLQKYRAKYGKLTVLILALALSLLAGRGVNAQTSDQDENLGVPPPVVTSVSRNITNEEIFYIGGRTGLPNSSVDLYIQNAQTIETQSELVTTDENGDWFYRSDHFLSPGRYLIWAQTESAGQQSPPSSQIQVNVESRALQLGATKFSYAAIYLILLLLAILLLLLLAGYSYYHYSRGRRKHKMMMDQIAEAEASVRRGFAVLNRDLEAELAALRETKSAKELSAQEAEREAQLTQDLKDIEQRLSREIWQVEDTEMRT